jgi:hypothetical protein
MSRLEAFSEHPEAIPRDPAIEQASEFWSETIASPESNSPEAPSKRHPLYFDDLLRGRVVGDALLNRHVQTVAVEQGRLAAALEVNKAPQLDGYSRTMNCGECARAVVMTLDGDPTGAGLLDADVPDAEGLVYEGEQDLRIMASWIGEDFDSIENGFDLADRVTSYENGQHGIIAAFARQEPNMGHFFNVSKIDGKVLLIDGQAGTSRALNIDEFDTCWADVWLAPTHHPLSNPDIDALSTTQDREI